MTFLSSARDPDLTSPNKPRSRSVGARSSPGVIQGDGEEGDRKKRSSTIAEQVSPQKNYQLPNPDKPVPFPSVLFLTLPLFAVIHRGRQKVIVVSGVGIV